MTNTSTNLTEKLWNILILFLCRLYAAPFWENHPLKIVFWHKFCDFKYSHNLISFVCSYSFSFSSSNFTSLDLVWSMVLFVRAIGSWICHSLRGFLKEFLGNVCSSSLVIAYPNQLEAQTCWQQEQTSGMHFAVKSLQWLKTIIEFHTRDFGVHQWGNRVYINTKDWRKIS